MSSREYYPEDDFERNERVSNRREGSRRRIEEELQEFKEDENKLGREILHLKKELNRLHYKVKSYQQKNRSTQFIFGITTLLLLAVIVWKLMGS